MSENSPCTRRVGTCCSRCTAPLVTTELISGDPWDALFEWGAGSENGIGGTTTQAGEPFVYTFTITPGDTLPYYRVEFDNGEFDWDPSAAIITDEDGTVVTPDIVWDEPQTFTLTLDPANMQTPGDYPGGINIDRYPSVPSEPYENERTTKEGTITITEDCDEYTRIVHARTDDFVMTILPFHAATVYGQFPLVQIGPTEDCDGNASTAEWSVDIDITLAGGASYTLNRNDVTLVEGNTYGPEAGFYWFWIQMNLTHAGLVDGSDYEGTITINSNGQRSVRNIVIRCRTGGGTAPGHTFQITNPGSVTRGTAFDLEVTAIDNTTGVVDTDYNGGNLKLNLTSIYSPADEPDPETYASAGKWVDGVLTIPDFSFDSGSGGWPFLQVYDTSNGTYGVIQFVGLVFTIIVPDVIYRGVAFDMTVTHNDTSYVPANALTVAWTLSDVGDSGLPATISTAGWASGSKTVSCTITGGADEDTFSVEVTDTDTLGTGEGDGDIQDTAPGACPGSPPLLASYTLAWTGLIEDGDGTTAFPSGSSVLTDGGTFNCWWSNYGIYITLDVVNLVWTITFALGAAWNYAVWIEAEKGGSTPVGNYTVTYRRTSVQYWLPTAPISNTIGNIIV